VPPPGQNGLGFSPCHRKICTKGQWQYTQELKSLRENLPVQFLSRPRIKGCPISPISCGAKRVPSSSMRLSLKKGAHATGVQGCVQEIRGISLVFCEMWDTTAADLHSSALQGLPIEVRGTMRFFDQRVLTRTLKPSLFCAFAARLKSCPDTKQESKTERADSKAPFANRKAWQSSPLHRG
jgi:hypothetical protein